jgi:hypothetical protein
MTVCRRLDLTLLDAEQLGLTGQAQLFVDHISGVIALEEGQCAILQLGDMGDDGVQEVAVVGDDDHRAGVFVDQALQVGFTGQVQVVVRLVQEEHIRAGQEQPGQADQLLLPAGEVADGGVKIQLVQAQAAQQLLTLAG